MINRLDLRDCVVSHRLNRVTLMCEVHIVDGAGLFKAHTFFTGETFEQAYDKAKSMGYILPDTKNIDKKDLQVKL